MKAILISIRPQHTCNILNGIKLWEIRKKFPKDYVGWVYIYVTKNSFLFQTRNGKWVSQSDHFYESCNPIHYEGKVVARFWCDKVEEYVNGHKWSWKSGAPMWGACNDYEYILKDTCLTEDELYDYCEDLSFKAIHIIKLEIFDKPKEISEFSIKKCKTCIANDGGCYLKNECQGLPLTRAPQSWCYIEI